MPSRSHGRCKVCRAVIHSSHRFGMCKQCSDKHNARIRAERRAAHERRRLRALPSIVLEEDQPMPKEFETTDEPVDLSPPPDKRSRRQLTDDQEVEILDAYTKTDEPVDAISKRFGVRGTYIYNVLNRVGVTWRRGNPESFMNWQSKQASLPKAERVMHAFDDAVPEPQQKALENMLKLPVLPPRPEPVAPTPAIERRVPPEPLMAFDVVVEGRLRIRAVDMLSAMQQVLADHPGLRVTQISEV